MSSYLIVTSSGLFLLKFLKERGVQKSVFQNCFKTNEIAGSDNCKVFPWKILRVSKNKDHFITL